MKTTPTAQMNKMNILRSLTIGVAALSLSCASFAQDNDANSNSVKPLQITARVGYSVGGTTPIGMPASIRGLNSFSPRFNLLVGADVYYHVGGKWGFAFAPRVENKGMRTDANVKDYSMEMRKGTDFVKGRFTGSVVTECDQWMITVPLVAAFDVRKVRVTFGPFVSAIFNSNFSGYAYDGYLRQGDPTGAKVIIGHEADTRGDYDFSDDLRDSQFGAIIGADWHIGSHLGAFANFSWGFSRAFRDSFETIEQNMYPLYGTVGVFYAF